MTFIDNIAYALFSVTFAAFLMLYTSGSMYLVHRRKQHNYIEYLRAAAVPLAVIGAFMIVEALWGQFLWPLPGSYNTLFYDPLLSFGLLLVSFALSVKYRAKLEYVGFFSLLVGIMVILYGVQGYMIGLTASPIAMFAMYLLYGLAGIVAYPVALTADQLLGSKKHMWRGWPMVFITFCIILLLAACLSAITGVLAVSAHLLSAP